MNEVFQPFAPVLEVLASLPLTFRPVRVEQNRRGEDLLVLSCQGFPRRDFLYVPGKRNAVLGWDTSRCPLPPGIEAAFHQYYLKDLDYRRGCLEEDREDYLEELGRAATEEQRQECEGLLRETEEDLRALDTWTWEDYLGSLLTDLDACTSPLRTADIPPMVVERWSWTTPEAIEPPFSLPTEDEWEYLCSGGVHSLFPWGDALDLDAVGKETLDKDAKNAFGLVIGNACRAERVAGDAYLKGDDGGCALCGGEADRAAFPYSPYFRYTLPRFSWIAAEPDREAELAKRHRRRVLRLPAL